MNLIIISILVWLTIKGIIFMFDVFGYQYEMKFRKQVPHATPPPSKPNFQIFKK